MTVTVITTSVSKTEMASNKKDPEKGEKSTAPAADATEENPERTESFAGRAAKGFYHYIFSIHFFCYLCSTHFWGPLANWGIPIAAFIDMTKSCDIISPWMTGVLIIYSILFAIFALKVRPLNRLLFLCHSTNIIAQIVQMTRWTVLCGLKKKK